MKKDFNEKRNDLILKVAHSNSEATLFWFINEEYLGSTHKNHEFSVSPRLGNFLVSVVDNFGHKVKNPKFLKHSEEKIKDMQRQLARRNKGSSNWQKTKARLNKLQGKVKRQRLDFSHKISNTIAKSSDIVVFEDLHVKGMQQFKIKLNFM